LIVLATDFGLKFEEFSALKNGYNSIRESYNREEFIATIAYKSRQLELTSRGMYTLLTPAEQAEKISQLQADVTNLIPLNNNCSLELSKSSQIPSSSCPNTSQTS
jgi:hypothetical protein